MSLLQTPSLSQAPVEQNLRPTRIEDRIVALDVVRGFAVIGIFAMNLMLFALPSENPAIAGGDQGLDLFAFYVHDPLFMGRMRALFCMLFGAGLVLSWQRSASAGAAGALRMHRRNVVLLSFGLAHIFLLQMPGDILFAYSLCAFVLWGFAAAKPRSVAVAAVVLLIVVSGFNVRSELADKSSYERAEHLSLRHSAGETLDEEETGKLESFREAARGDVGQRQRKASERVEERNGATTWRSTWVVLSEDLFGAIEIQSSGYVGYLALLSSMLFGMALFHYGFLTGAASNRCYVLVLVLGTLSALAAHWLSRDWRAGGFSGVDFSNFVLWKASFETLRLLGALGWVSLLVLSLRWLGTSLLHRVLASLGRMALTVYLLETVIATILFYGWGFGLYGQWSRFELLLLTAAVGLVLGIVANLWLRRFRNGPVEWLWRRLSYGKV